jgi:hypothetical protein
MKIFQNESSNKCWKNRDWSNANMEMIMLPEQVFKLLLCIVKVNDELTVIYVCPGVMRFDAQCASIHHSKTICYVCAQWCINVFWDILPNTLPARRGTIHKEKQNWPQGASANLICIQVTITLLQITQLYHMKAFPVLTHFNLAEHYWKAKFKLKTLWVVFLHFSFLCYSYGLDSQGSISGSARLFSSPQHRLSGPPSLLLNGYQGLFPRG